MFTCDDLLNPSSPTLATLQHDLRTAGSTPLGRPVAVQLAGNDPAQFVQCGLLLQDLCDAIDINLGCPQKHAQQGHYGGYLLNKSDWPTIEKIVHDLRHFVSIPVYVKIRLCTPHTLTPILARKLVSAGASVVILHARYVSQTRRRKGSALLEVVRAVKEELKDEKNVLVLSNGNVRCWDDCVKNRQETGADGVMVGEALLGNPRLFNPDVYSSDPFELALEYLSIVHNFPETASLSAIKQHVKNMVAWNLPHARHPTTHEFLSDLEECNTLIQIEVLLEFTRDLRKNVIAP